MPNVECRMSNFERYMERTFNVLHCSLPINLLPTRVLVLAGHTLRSVATQRFIGPCHVMPNAECRMSNVERYMERTFNVQFNGGLKVERWMLNVESFALLVTRQPAPHSR